MRTKCRSIATFHRLIHSHWSLPLRKTGKGKYSVVDPDANADLYGINFNQNVKKTTLFSRRFQYTVQNTKTYGNYDTDEKEKTMNFNLALL
jgi:hypothetical protein